MEAEAMHSSKRPHLLHKRGRVGEPLPPAMPISNNAFDDVHHLEPQVCVVSIFLGGSQMFIPVHVANMSSTPRIYCSEGSWLES